MTGVVELAEGGWNIGWQSGERLARAAQVVTPKRLWQFLKP